MRVLVIEDEPRMSALLYKGLSEHGHDVTLALNGAEGLKCTLDQEFEVVLLDIGLPDLNGYDVAQVLRERRNPASILMLTAYNREDQIVRCLNVGADDYLTKPFSFLELLARVRAITRPAPELAPAGFSLADMVVDRIRRKVMRRDEVIDLTRTEFMLLELLAQNSPHTVSRSLLHEGIWAGNKEVSSGALDVLVNALRSKLDSPFPTRLVHTVRGVGYRLKAESPASSGTLSERRIQ